MNATSSTTQPLSPGDSSWTRDIDASCRAPLFTLLVSAAFWLVAASVLGLIASIKFHGPNFLADCEWLTYGRVQAATTTVFLYGFALQAGFAVSLWIIARLGQTRVIWPWMIALGGKFWNLGVFLGVCGILAGSGTGFENLGMPRYSAVFLFVGYLLIGIYSVMTLHDRKERSLEPSQWFLLVALFWFPWIFSTAEILLVFCPLRGVTQAVIAWWYAANLNLVWMGLVGLAVAFFFIPRLIGKPLHSRALAMFAFVTLILCGSWSGIPASAPVPAWITALSTVATVLTVIPVIAVALNLYQTVRGCSQTSCPIEGKFIAFGLMAFVGSWAMNIASAVPQVGAVTSLTWFTVARSQLNSYGFFAMMMFGAIYYLMPRVIGMNWPNAKFVRLHYWIAAAGILLIVVPLAIGGVVQGIKAGNPSISPVDLSKATLMFLRVSTMGELLLTLGHVLFFVNLSALAVRFSRSLITPAYVAATTELKPVGVRP